MQDEIITITPTKHPRPQHTRRRKDVEKKKGETRRNEEKKAHAENEAPGKKQVKR